MLELTWLSILGIVSGYAVSPEDVVQVKQGENITVSTSADLETHKVKVTNTQGQLVGTTCSMS